MLLCIDPDQEDSVDDAASAAVSLLGHMGLQRVITIYTKSDLFSGFIRSTDNKGISLSVHTGEGLDLLRSEMLQAVFSGLREAEEIPLVTRRRHTRALGQARDSLSKFRETWSAGHPPEIAAAHLQDAVLPLEEMLGVITNEDVLDVLFADFCVGK